MDAEPLAANAPQVIESEDQLDQQDNLRRSLGDIGRVDRMFLTVTALLTVFLALVVWLVAALL